MRMETVVNMLLALLVMLNGCYLVSCQRPAAVNVGAIFTFDSVIGRVAKPAIEAAVSDVNSDSSILNGTELKLIMEDTEGSVFMGSVKAFQVLEKRVVAIIGPQSSSIAHMISQIANGVQVPLISYAATDPTLSSIQFPFFLRTTQSDSHQMAAMACLIDFYGWKQIISIFVDDDFGRNGISVLDDELQKLVSRTSYKISLPAVINDSDIGKLLNESKLLGPRVYVVHVSPDLGLRLLSVAYKLQMMSRNYVWLTTDWLSTVIDSSSELQSPHTIQGVISLRQHTPESSLKKEFITRWRRMQQNSSGSLGLNVYGLYAYDTVWSVARAIDQFLKEQENFTFSSGGKLHDANSTSLLLGSLESFVAGNVLLRKLEQTNFTGMTGQIRFDKDRNLLSGSYEVINVNRIAHKVGYWSNISGLSVVAPEMIGRKNSSFSHLDQKLLTVIWPGGMSEKPRGWIANGERPLRIGVPYRASFAQFVTTMNSSHEIQGYCVDVFNQARKLVPYDVPVAFIPFGDGRSNPNYNNLVKSVSNGVFDGVVGDVAVTTNRTKFVDFTQPYIATGLVIVAPMKTLKSNAWVFLKPFSVEMWCVTVASFFMVGLVIWILEHRVNNDFRGPPRRQLLTMILFSFSTLFKTNQESTISPLGRFVMVIWLFLLMVITASYTASLTSILTIQKLSSPVTGIESLITTHKPIGYQVGSFAYGYLSDNLGIEPSRLKSLRSPEEYGEALRLGPDRGGVAAIVDELPYVELFLSDQTEFGIVGQPFTKSGWGFAFPRESPLAIDLSTAILKLSETGELRQIYKKWFCKPECPEERRTKYDPDQLHLINFWGLYLLSVIVTFAAVVIFLQRSLRQFVRYKRQHQMAASSSQSTVSSTATCSQLVYNFFDFIDEKEDAIKNMFTERSDGQT